jgi:hypothetical protein
MLGPSGRKVSKDLERIHCPPLGRSNCQLRPLTVSRDRDAQMSLSKRADYGSVEPHRRLRCSSPGRTCDFVNSHDKKGTLGGNKMFALEGIVLAHGSARFWPDDHGQFALVVHAILFWRKHDLCAACNQSVWGFPENYRLFRIGLLHFSSMGCIIEADGKNHWRNDFLSVDVERESTSLGCLDRK